MWAFIIGDKLIGPYVLQELLNGHSYLRFLRDQLQALLEDVPYVRRDMWNMHDGAPEHILRPVYSISTLRITIAGLEMWHPWHGLHCPQTLTVWVIVYGGHLNVLVYRDPVQDVNTLR